MNTQDPTLARRFEALERGLRADPELTSELQDSQSEFFYGRFSAAAVDRDPAARRRHLEWFLFERVAAEWERLGIEHVTDRLDPSALGDDLTLDHALLHSFTGVFVVESVGAEGELGLVDLATLDRFPTASPRVAGAIGVGDLLAGRVFPTPGGDVELSPAVVHARNPDLVRALRADFERARAARRGVVRISQREIERMFFAGGALGRPADPVGEARALLTAAGVEEDEITGWLEDLAETPFVAESLRVGLDDALGPILDRLAFDSGVDLEAARRALLFAWEDLSTRGAGTGPSLQPKSPPARAPERVSDVRQAVAAFEEKRREGRPLDVVFDELEAALGVADGAEAADEDDAGPEFPGVVGALVTEFLWEKEREHGAEHARGLARIESFGRYAREIGVFENLSARDLLAYTAWWLPESGELENADDARSALAALASFCQWSRETQEVDLRTPFEAIAGGLRASLPRITEANRRRTRTTDRSQGELFEILALDADRLRVRDRSRRERDARVDPDLAPWLAVGDRLRGELGSDGRLAVYCAYPPESVGLEGSQRVG